MSAQILIGLSGALSVYVAYVLIRPFTLSKVVSTTLEQDQEISLDDYASELEDLRIQEQHGVISSSELKDAEEAIYKDAAKRKLSVDT